MWKTLTAHTKRIQRGSCLKLTRWCWCPLSLKLELTTWDWSSVAMSPAELSSPCSTNLSLERRWFTERKSHYFQIDQWRKDKTFHACPKKQRPSSLTNLKAKAAERHIYFHGSERYNLMSLCGFGWAERLHLSGGGYTFKNQHWKRRICFLKASAFREYRQCVSDNHIFHISFCIEQICCRIGFHTFQGNIGYFLEDLGDWQKALNSLTRTPTIIYWCGGLYEKKVLSSALWVCLVFLFARLGLNISSFFRGTSVFIIWP